MRKKILYMFIPFIVALCCFLLIACNSTSKMLLIQKDELLLYKGIYYKLSADETHYMVAGIEEDTRSQVTVMDTLMGLPVQEIGAYAFRNHTQNFSFLIPNGITKIGEGAFSGCSGLTAVVLSDKVTVIADGTFSGCSGLTEISIGKNITSIGASAFSDCTGLKAVEFPDSVTTIGEQAFYRCTGLTSVVIPNSVTSIGNGAFDECSGLTEATIPTYALETIHKENISTLVLTNGETIKRNVFRDCTKLTSIVIPDSVTSIGEYAFYGCSGLEKIVIPDSVTTIGTEAFFDCNGLKEVTMPICAIDAVSKDKLVSVVLTGSGSIGENAFSASTQLTTLVIPDGVTSIGDGAFFSCTNLSVVTMPIHAIEAIPKEKLTTVRLTSGERIGENAFCDCALLTSVVIPDSVTYIDDSAFSGCEQLSYNLYGNSCYIGNSLHPYVALMKVTQTTPSCDIHPDTKVIYGKAFSDCENITSIVIPAQVTHIGGGVFRFCDRLNAITISEENENYYSEGNCLIERASKILLAGCNNSILPTGGKVEKIGSYAFSGRFGLTTIEIPDSVTVIEDGAFYGCSGLLTFTVSGDPVYGKDVFTGCSNLKSVTVSAIIIHEIPKTNLTSVVLTGGNSLEENEFKGCTRLTNLVLPDSITSIGQDAFFGCDNIISVTYPTTAIPFVPKAKLQNVVLTSGERIEDYEFSNCTDLLSVAIPVSVTAIGRSAFPSSLEAIHIGDIGKWCSLSLEFSALYTFTLYLNGKVITDLVVPEGVTNIGTSVFSGCKSLVSVSFPDSLLSIGDYAFYDCNGLTTVNIPNSVQSIGYKAFYDCNGLTSLVIGDGVTAIGDYAFRYCDRLISVTIGKDVNSIGIWAFEGCYRLAEVYNRSTSLTVTKGSTINEYVGYYAKDIYTTEFVSKISVDEKGYVVYTDGAKKSLIAYFGEESELTVPNGITEIDQYVFYQNDKVTAVHLPDSVTDICDYAFSNCTRLNSMVLPDQVVNIGYEAFKNCCKMTSLTIGSGVKSIKTYAFSDCYKLVEIYNKSTVTLLKGDYNNGYAGYYAKNIYTSAGVGKLSTDQKGFVYYTDGSDVILMGYLGQEAEPVLPDTVTEIYSYAFYGCEELTAVVIPSGVTKIGKNLFEKCEKLVSVTVASGNEKYHSAGNCIIETATKILVAGCKNSTIPTDGSVTSIGKYAFSDHTGLTSVVVPKNITDIGEYAFENCTGLISVVLSEDVIEISEYAFEGCVNLQKVYYEGTSSAWNEVLINDFQPTATRYFYSENEPTEEGSFWHYDVDGVTILEW